jgi:hypothetical protein
MFVLDIFGRHWLSAHINLTNVGHETVLRGGVEFFFILGFRVSKTWAVV